MKRFFSMGLLTAVGVAAVGAATVPIFINDTPTVLPDDQLPTINAEAFVNRSTFSVSPFSANFGIGGVVFGFSSAAFTPYETFNTSFYTNEIGATMSGSPGFRFMTTRGRTRVPAQWFVNEGAIATSGYLEVRANNVVSTGPMGSSEFGLIRVKGTDVDLSQTALRTGTAPNANTFFFFTSLGANEFGRPRYFNAPGIADVYWGVGSNGVFLGNGRPTPLPGLFNLPRPSTPAHEVETFFGRTLFTNRVSLPKFNAADFSFFAGTNFFTPPTNFAAFVYTNIVDGTSPIVQVVFVRTNSPDGQLSANVRFVPGTFASPQGEIDGPAQAIVEVRHWDFDLALDQFNTNAFYLVDSMAIRTNLSLFRLDIPRANTRRPNVYELFTSQPFEWAFDSVPPNSTFTNGLLDVGYLSNRVEMRYAAYSASLTNGIASLVTNTLGVVTPSLLNVNPTNLGGRIELFGDQLNLNQVRIRAESTLFVRTKDLIGNTLARTDAPFVGYDLTSTQPELVISNLASSSVQRFSGPICAWSGLWKNYRVENVGTNMTTNEINFHVLVVDHNFQSAVPSAVFHFVAHANHLVVTDPLNMYDPFNRFRRVLQLDTPSLEIRPGGGISLPVGASWGKTNILRLVNLTNSGFIFVPGTAKYGTDRSEPYQCIINDGTNTAAAQLVRAQKFQNSGCIVSTIGPIQIDADTTRIEGPPQVIVTNISTTPVFPFAFDTNGNLVTEPVTNLFVLATGAKVQSFANLQIKAQNMSVSNSVLSAGFANPTFLGRLTLNVSGSLVDAGPEAVNLWSCTAGFEMRTRPATSSLLGTWLTTTVPANRQVSHFWPAQDLGATTAGYADNVALGKLTIDISPNNGRAIFRSPNGQHAIYADYIELFNAATNFNSTISINPNMTIYFANANVPASKLDGAVGGRFVWVPSFAGPLSSTNITYPSGNTYTFNIALVTSKDIDSDGDGIVNADDPTPIAVPGEPNSRPAFMPASAGPARVPIETTVSTGPPTDLRLSVALDDSRPSQAKLSWQPLANTTSTIEFKEDWMAREWQVLTNVVSGTAPLPATVYDSITKDGHMRIYRLRIGTGASP